MSVHHYLRGVMSGAERGVAAGALRAALAAAEPFYAAGIWWRNRCYDRHPDRIQWLPRPVVSIGNITAGGTGKTPIIRWLAGRLRDEGRRVAVFARGYKATPGALGDEQQMLASLLNGQPPPSGPHPSSHPPMADPNVPRRRMRVIIQAHPDRYAAGRAALREEPQLGVFLLDDGFQHRRLARDLDIVLINATEPFGFGHVLPRGLLREPPAGLSRAGAIVLTHASSVDPSALEPIEREVRRHNPSVPLYRAIHSPQAIRTKDAAASELPVEALRSRRVFTFCGIGDPSSFDRELEALCGSDAGHRWFGDHHAYTASDLAELRAAAREGGADVLVTTEKDWVKLAPLDRAADADLPLWRLDIRAAFLGDDEARLLAQVRGVIEKSRPAIA